MASWTRFAELTWGIGAALWIAFFVLMLGTDAVSFPLLSNLIDR